MTPSRAFLTSSVLVLTCMPGAAGMAHEATGLGALATSTRHILQLPATESFWW